MRIIHTQNLAKKDLQAIWLYSFKNWGEKQADKYFDAQIQVRCAISKKEPIFYLDGYWINQLKTTAKTTNKAILTTTPPLAMSPATPLTNYAP